MNWSDFYLPPINLWNKPLQHKDYKMNYDNERAYKMNDDNQRAHNNINEETTCKPQWVIKEVKADDDNEVNHPSHYTQGGIEVNDYIEAKGLDKNWNLANVVKYVSRADYKANKLVDLKKARVYLSREIKKLESMPDV